MQKPITDRYIDNLEDDRLGRIDYILNLSDYLVKSFDDSEILKETSLTIGVYGEWGSGKTSVLKCIEKEIKKEPSKINTLWFNPWMYKDEEQIVLSLFKLLSKGRLSTAQANKLITPLLTMIFGVGKAALTLKGVPATGKFVDGTKEALGALFHKEDKDALELKESINKEFNKKDRPTIVFIDDVDRLSNSELKVLFKTVRLFADFSNVCYVLAFDQNAVAKSISSEYGSGKEDDGVNYIEKIINIPTELPKIKPENLYIYFKQHLLNNELPNNDFLKDIFVAKIHTARQAKRLANAYYISQFSTKELNQDEIFVLETLKLTNSWELDLLRELTRNLTNNDYSLNKDNFIKRLIGPINSFLKQTNEQMTFESQNGDLYFKNLTGYSMEELLKVVLGISLSTARGFQSGRSLSFQSIENSNIISEEFKKRVRILAYYFHFNL